MTGSITARNIALCALLLPLAACVDPDQRNDNTQSMLIVPPMMNTRPATFKCDDTGMVVVRPVGEDGSTITLALRGREAQLKKVPATEGQKYSDGTTVFWMNGPNATLLAGGKSEPESCEQR
ncbi:MAG: MliC family protein [Micropepsaceae bacterium]